MAKKCTICGKAITLIPSAAERAKKFGGNPSDYTSLFTAHTTCQLKQRQDDARELTARLRKEHAASNLPHLVGPLRNAIPIGVVITL